MKEPINLFGKKVLITGGARGIGFSSALEFSRRGAIPVIADINRRAVDMALEEFRGRGAEAYGFQVDITNIAAVRALRSELTAMEMTPDVLANCAGFTLVARINVTTQEDFTDMINVNVLGTINMVDTFLPEMLGKRQGHIVNVGSIDGFVPIPGHSAYCTSKFAVTGFSEVLYYDLKHRGVRVTLVCPGYVNTPMSQALPVRDIAMQFRGSHHLLKVIEKVSTTPEKIALKLVDSASRDKFLVIPGIPSQMMYHYRRLFPRVATRSGVATAKFFDRLRQWFDVAKERNV